MAEHLAARREREKRLQDDLAAFFKTEDKLATARERRDVARARADERYKRDTAAVHQRRGELVTAMREAGQTVADIAGLTGLSAADVRELHRAAGNHAEQTAEHAEQTAEKDTGTTTADTADKPTPADSRPVSGQSTEDGSPGAAAS